MTMSVSTAIKTLTTEMKKTADDMKKTEAEMKRHERAGTRGIPADYPLQTCVISGEKLGAHGDPIKVTQCRNGHLALLQIL